MVDVFISYRRGCAQPSGLSVSKALEDKEFKHPRTREPIRIFWDRSSLDPGVEWREALKRHASHCKVIVVLAGPDWLDQFRADSFRALDQLNSDRPTDWVAAELHFALATGDAPASLLVVKADEKTNLSAAAEVFKQSPQVSQAFARQEHQQQLWNDQNADTAKLQGAIISAILTYDERQTHLQGRGNQPEAATVASATSARQAEHWLRFIGRDNQWKSVEEALGVRGRNSPVFARGKAAANAFAFCWQVEAEDDEPAHLSAALAHYLGAQGALEDANRDFTDEARCSVEQANVASYFTAVAERLGFAWELETTAGPDLSQKLQREFVPLVCSAVGSGQLSGCIRFQVLLDRKSRTQKAEYGETAARFCALWNGLDWSGLGAKLAVVFFLVGGHRRVFWRKPASCDISYLTPDCYNQWRTQFIEARLNLNPWLERLAGLRPQSDFRYRDIKKRIVEHVE